MKTKSEYITRPVFCPYCGSDIKSEDKHCMGCDKQYFINFSNSKKSVFLQEVDSNVCVPISYMRSRCR